MLAPGPWLEVQGCVLCGGAMLKLLSESVFYQLLRLEAVFNRHSVPSWGRRACNGCHSDEEHTSGRYWQRRKINQRRVSER